MRKLLTPEGGGIGKCKLKTSSLPPTTVSVNQKAKTPSNNPARPTGVGTDHIRMETPAGSSGYSVTPSHPTMKRPAMFPNGLSEEGRKKLKKTGHLGPTMDEYLSKG